MLKQALSFTWAFELLQNKDKIFANACIMILDFSVVVIAGIYFLLADLPNWKHLGYPWFCFGALGYALCSFLLPESPKWLLL